MANESSDVPEQIERPAPPPFDPDPDLITNLEGGRKPTAEEVRAVADR